MTSSAGRSTTGQLAAAEPADQTRPDTGEQGTDRTRATISDLLKRMYPAAVVVLVVAAAQASSVFLYSGDRVDESEIVHFTVGFFGGDLDPGWYAYGSLNMYLLGSVYAVLYAALRLLGVVTSRQDYASLLFAEGYFFQVARYVYAVYAVGAMTVYGILARRVGAPWLLLMGWLALWASSPEALRYANYIRTDQLVSLLTALAVLVVATSPSRRRLLLLAALAAAAMATKFSSLGLVALLGGTALWWWYRGAVRFRHVALAALVFALLLVAFQPFINPIEHLLDIFARGADATYRFGIVHHASLPSRLGAITRALYQGVGPLVVGSLILLPLARGAVARAARFVTLVLLLHLAPFVISREITSYWFIPSFHLLWALGLLGVLSLGFRLQSAWRGEAGPRRVAAGAVAALALMVGASRIVAHWAQVLEAGPSSRDTAAAWLVEQLDEGEVVRLDAPYLYSLPRVYDPSEPLEAKEISRAFIFDRWQHPYLNETFIEWLAGDYRRDTGLEVTAVRLLRGLRVDATLPTGTSGAVRLSLCHVDGTACEPLPLDAVEVTGASLDSITPPEGLVRLAATESVQRIRVADLELVGDGSRELHVLVTGPVRKPPILLLDQGEGLDESLKRVIEEGDTLRVPLWLPTPQGRVLALEPALERDALAAYPENGLYVTSPSVYARFLDGRVEDVPLEAREKFLALRRWYKIITAEGPVQRFSGAGAPVEIYRFTGPLRERLAMVSRATSAA